MNTYEEINSVAEQVECHLLELRRKLHEIPEQSMREYKTAEMIVQELEQLEGIKVIKNLANGTGVMGILEGTKPGRCIMLRADIDALPIEEKNSLDYKSKNKGFMHACGHDAHITWILGSAMILSRMRHKLSGTVKFVFQPGEEIGRGAIEMIEKDLVLENPRVDMAFAAHTWPSIDAGKIGIAKKYAFGCPGGFQFIVKGRGGHGSWPHLSINPIMVATQICTLLPRIISERVDAIEPRVISIGAIHAGKQGVGNIIPEECVVNGTIRAVKMQVMEELIFEIQKIVKNCCVMYGAEYEFESHISGNAVENKRELVELCEKSAQNILGKEQVHIIEKDNLGGENFSEYSTRVPATYMYIGIRNEELGEEFSLHSPKYLLDESVLKKASAVFAAIVFDAENYNA